MPSFACSLFALVFLFGGLFAQAQSPKAGVEQEFALILQRELAGEPWEKELSAQELADLEAVLGERLQALPGDELQLKLSQAGQGKLRVDISGVNAAQFLELKKWLFLRRELSFHRVDAEMTDAFLAGEEIADEELMVLAITPLGSNPELGFTEEEKDGGAGAELVLFREVEITSMDLERAFPSRSAGGWVIDLTLDQAGGEKMLALTEEIIGQRLALVLDGVLISAPSVMGAFGKSFQITGNFSQDEVFDLAEALSHPLPIEGELAILEQLPVGEVVPHMGVEKEGVAR